MPRRRRAAAVALLAALLAPLMLAGCVQLPAAPAAAPERSAARAVVAGAEVRQALVPTGTLRIAVYPGSPTSMVGADRATAATGQPRGLTVELGRELARRLGVPSELVVFDRVAQVVDALHAGQADMTITNATPARAALVDFTAPVVGLELGVLVLAGSPVTTVASMDQPGVRVGVSQGSSSQAALGQRLQHAVLVPADSLAAATTLLKERRIDAFATNKGILFQLADQLPGAQVLPGRWGLESLALAVPPARRAGADFLQAFVADPRTQALVQQAAQRAGLRGTAEPERP
ncbi:transporter substrate-binding domain-containing protein [Aquincola tertiaricarbonis]|uniref:transporter substrate-binding domain-containing protein n=1 Tax=Aquincola tertiaricarbonis TaxID=391953 RepID=UPI000615069B|nr:transporter substrate-binding domain-containing protein [Aquincola tertiaricarbonis]